jgi:2-polyprenyl-6-hydroxyphenyl methylase/3-demethylubiquinone-9 3-methyltransferase
VDTTHTQSRDPAEIAKFDALAHGFWDANGAFRPLHRLNSVRVEYIAARVNLVRSRALDVGCGGGLLAEALTQRGAKLTAIDLAPAMIETARLHAAASGLVIDYRLQDAAEIAASTEKRFDIVCCLEMLEHVPEPAATLKVLSKLLAPGGTLFISTVNRNAKSFFTAIVGAEYVLRLLPRGTHEYARFIRPAELAAWARSANLSLTHMAGLEYQPFTDACRLSEDVSVNYIATFTSTDSAGVSV